MKEIILNVAMLTFCTIALGLIGNVFQLVKTKVEAEKVKAEQEKNELKKRVFTAAETVLDNVVAVTVGKIEQVTAGDLREQVKAGNANYEDLKILARDAYYEIIDTVQKNVLDELSEGVEDYETYIMNKIENQVRLLKKDKKLESDGGAA